MSKSVHGVAARRKPALAVAAVAGLAGLSLGSLAHAADLADADAPTVTAIDVEGKRNQPTDPKLTTDPLNTPQTITVVTKGVIEAQNLLSLREILSTVPGITFGAGEGGGGFGDSINLRGYSANNDITIDGIRDSAQYTRSDPFNLEQIEVTNGANSVYSGSGSVGGTINIVSKRPSARNSRTLTGGVGTDNYYRATADMNQRLNDKVAVRLNAMVHHQDAAGRKVEQFERWGVAPSITIGLDGPTQFTALYVHQEDDNVPQYGVPFYNGRPLPGVSPKTYYGFRNIDKQEQQVDMLTGIIDHDFGDGLTVRNLSRYQKVTQNLVVDPPQGTWCLANGTKPVGWSQTTTATNLTGFTPCLATDPAPGFYLPSGPRGNLRDTENTLLYNQTDLAWAGDVGGLRHSVVAGAAFLSEDFRLDSGNILRQANGAVVVFTPMNIPDPNTLYAGPVNYVRGSIQEGERQNQAVYLFDNIEFNAKISVNFGLRYEHNEGSNRTDAYSTVVGPTLGIVTPGPTFPNDENLFTYRAGLVYKPIPNASLYVAYGNSQTPSQATVNGSGACNATTCNVKPEKAENFEVGAKWDVHSKLSLTAALFRNDRSNYRVASGDPLTPELQLDGSARVEGVALGASGQVNEKWAIFANYTYLDSKVLQGVSDLIARQGQDFTKGDPIANVPDHSFSLFTTYNVTDAIQAGYSVTYQGEMYLTQHAAITGSTPPARTTIPLVKTQDYLVHRATVSWAVRRDLALRLNVTNLFDKVYYTRGRNNGWATPGERRSATLTAEYRF